MSWFNFLAGIIGITVPLGAKEMERELLSNKNGIAVAIRWVVGICLLFGMLFSITIATVPNRLPWEAFNLSFAEENLVRAEITIQLGIGDEGESLARKSFLTWEGNQLLLDNRPISTAPLKQLSESLRVLIPVKGLQHCSGSDADRQGPSIQQPSIEIRLWIRSFHTIRLRSDSSCAFMLPWNVTDGERLFVSYSPELGKAIEELVIPICSQCKMLNQTVTQPAEPVGLRESKFDDLYSALLAEWERLGSQGKQPRWVGIHTIHLLEAMRWMDPRRFENKLQRLLKEKDISENVRNMAIMALERTNRVR